MAKSNAPQRPTLVGGVSRALAFDNRPAEVVATVAVDRHLKSGTIDVIDLTERQLARVVAEGAAILSHLVNERARPHS